MKYAVLVTDGETGFFVSIDEHCFDVIMSAFECSLFSSETVNGQVIEIYKSLKGDITLRLIVD